MNIRDIRKMSDKQLLTYMNELSNRNGCFCAKCGEQTFTINRKTINVSVYERGYQKQKKLCNLCLNCYSDLLDYLGCMDPTKGEE